MKVDYEIAITLTRVTGFKTLVIRAIGENHLNEALELLNTELEAFLKVETLLDKIEGEKFKEFFPKWVPLRIEDIQSTIKKVERRIRQCND